MLNKRVLLIVANVYLRTVFLFHNDISLHFKLVLSNERLELCDKK